MDAANKGRRAKGDGLRFPSRNALCAWLTQTVVGRGILEEIESMELAAERTTNVEVVVTHLHSGRVGLDVYGPKWMRNFRVVSFVEIPETYTVEQHRVVCEIAEVESERSRTMRLVARHTVTPLAAPAFPRWIVNADRQLDAQALANAMRRMKGISK